MKLCLRGAVASLIGQSRGAPWRWRKPLAPDWLLDQLPVAGSVADGSLEDLGVDVGQVVVADDGEAGVWRRRPQAAT